MIGVVAKSSESEAVCEFFELFKTPWEWYRKGRRYEILICSAAESPPESEADLVVIYGGRKLPYDAEMGFIVLPREELAASLLYSESRIPIYGDCITFQGDAGFLVEETTGLAATCLRRDGTRTVARIGYDLFKEVQTLLVDGQPAANAGIPTLELHIAILRDLIVRNGAPLAEIPPVPEGFRFIASLTHDIDHPSVRRHKLDHTTIGFLYRAVVGSLIKVFRREIPVRNLLRNWAAAFKLPLVHLGLAKDFWYEFDRYVCLEEGLPSTFFVIPYEGKPGRLTQGPAPAFRASRYGVADIADKLRDLVSAGCEIGVHGIDAWIDSSSARGEMGAVREITKKEDIGVRMHWLYFDKRSPCTLDEAGANFDSTVGYNETVGYRAGTAQVYKPLGVERLLELPLHIMDTAMFFPVHLNLSFAEARERVSLIVDNAVRFGGAVTINWHDRSISPERCWDGFYTELVQSLKARGAWFATAGDAVSWFRMRRAAVFETDNGESDVPRVKLAEGDAAKSPALQLRVYNARHARPPVLAS